MNFFKIPFFTLTIITTTYCHSVDLLTGHHQLLTVTTSDWEEKQGNLRLYERTSDDSTWIPIGTSIPVVLGKAGLAWGIGLHPETTNMSLKKVEGDKKSPAGIFSLGNAFGFASYAKMNHLKIEYLHLDESIEAVDDPQSHHYNHIVSNKEVTPDWHSSEKMSEEPLYAIGLVINHNFPNPEVGAGSAVFFHIWRQKDSGTAGCTAMSQENLTTVLSWLERTKNPVLVQLPIFKYHELQNDWSLPNLSSQPETVRNLSSENRSAATYNLVNLSEVIPDIILDIRYASSNNFLGFPVYSKSACYLHKDVAGALIEVQKELSLMHLGLKVFDGYRPLSVQQMMWDAIQDERYVSNPAKSKGGHTRGTTVDLTLVDDKGNELEMPTEFDDFTERAHSDYPNVSETVFKNRALLQEVMKKHHFQALLTEWWHFDFEGWRDDIQFPPLDIDFEQIK
jgi:D-alanyl-D-alanine dipeptidase/L,D-peptidoglycan transpeptidase YkuD (ErfK/YbiS/YcfS/YnhG family)